MTARTLQEEGHEDEEGGVHNGGSRRILWKFVSEECMTHDFTIGSYRVESSVATALGGIRVHTYTFRNVSR